MTDGKKKAEYGTGHLVVAGLLGFGSGFGTAIAIGVAGDYLRTEEERAAAQRALAAGAAGK
jgi:hypothetical protein